MSSKKVDEWIIDKFAETISKDNLFTDIFEELGTTIKAGERCKEKIETILKKKKNENP